MRCLLRPCGEGERAGLRVARAVVAALVLAALNVAVSSAAHAQSSEFPSPTPSPTPSAGPSPSPTPTPTPSPSPTPTVTRSIPISRPDRNCSISVAISWSGSATRRPTVSRAACADNPGGGGASEAAEGPRYRTWGELYGISIDDRSAGRLCRRQAPDHGRRCRHRRADSAGRQCRLLRRPEPHQIDVPLALQSATLDLTQLGFNASVDKGPWTWAIALVHGFGNVSSSRDTGFGFAYRAHYGAQIDGALTELDYYWTMEQSRIVPKVGLEYVHASTDAFQEIGGLDPLTVSGANMSRARALAGAEIGHYWIFDREDPRPVRLRQVRRQFLAAASARCWSASDRRAFRWRGSARASMAPTPARRPRSASPTPRGSI